MPKRDYTELARDILEMIGGPSNVAMLTHCVTRLRFKLRDASLVNMSALEAIDGVMQVVEVPGQLQVVIGPRVYDVYEDVLKVGDLMGGGEVSAADTLISTESAGGIIGSLIDLISGVVAPALGVLASSGMIKGLISLAVFLGVLSTDDATYTILYAISDAFMYFLPIMLGFTAAKKFGMNEFVGAAIGGALTYPTIASLTGNDVVVSLFPDTFMQMDAYATLFGIPIVMPASGYASTLVPIVVACWGSSYVYRFLENHLPATIKIFAVPGITLIVGGIMTFVLLGPISTFFTNLIAAFFGFLYDIPVVGGAIAGGILGAVWQVLVIFGFHWALIPIALSNMSSMGYDFAITGQFGCTWAQIACVLVVIMKSKDRHLKDAGIAAFITGLFGTTEPAIYGVTLPLRTPFVLSCVAGAISGVFYGFLGTKTFILGYSGLLGLTSFIDARDEAAVAITGMPNEGISNMVEAIIGVAIAFATAFVLCWLFWSPKEESE